MKGRRPRPIVDRVCRWCDTPLTRRQIGQRGRYCTKSCSREHYHATHREASRQLMARGRATQRKQYIERLKVRLAGCRSMGDAYRLGYRTGYQVGAQARQRQDRKWRRAA